MVQTDVNVMIPPPLKRLSNWRELDMKLYGRALSVDKLNVVRHRHKIFEIFIIDKKSANTLARIFLLNNPMHMAFSEFNIGMLWSHQLLALPFTFIIIHSSSSGVLAAFV